MKDPIVTILVIIALSAVSNWLKRRAAAQEEETPTPAPPPVQPMRQPPVERKASPPAGKPGPSPVEDWEKEIRRLFDIEEPQQEAPRKPAPVPPVVVPPAPMPGRSSKPGPVRTAQPNVVRRNVPAAVVPPAVESEEGPEGKSTRFTRSSETQNRASRLSERVAEKMREVDHRTTHHHTSRPESRMVVSAPVVPALWLRDRVRVREAFVAGIVLGPPKSLE